VARLRVQEKQEVGLGGKLSKLHTALSQGCKPRAIRESILDIVAVVALYNSLWNKVLEDGYAPNDANAMRDATPVA
jgi:hypothetical protein